MRIILVTLTYPPEPASQLHELLTTLHKRYKLDVSVVTSTPSYPIGRIYPGFKNVFNSSITDGVKVYRGPVVPSQSKSLYHRFLFYFSNFLSTMLILFLRRSKKEEIFVVYQPPVSSFLAFYFFQILRKRKFIFWINDMWPETLVSYGFRNRLVIEFIENYYKKIYRKAWRIVVISPGFKELLVKKGVIDNKIDVIYNWYSGSNSSVSTKKCLNSPFKLVYAGNLGKFQNLVTVIEAIKLVKSQGYSITFDIFGQGTEFDSLQNAILRLSMDQTVFLRGRIGHDQVFQELLKSDALFVQLIPNDLFIRTIPHKIYEYMAAGRPIIGALQGDAKNEITNAGCGITCTPNCPTSIAESLIEIIELSAHERNNLGERGKKFVLECRNIDIASKKFYSLLNSHQA